MALYSFLSFSESLNLLIFGWIDNFCMTCLKRLSSFIYFLLGEYGESGVFELILLLFSSEFFLLFSPLFG